MNLKKQTIQTYDNSAKELSEYFAGIGSRVTDIERGFNLINKQSNVKVVEIGCGDGRDAYEIIKRADKYFGIDPSSGLLDIARTNNPNGNFLLNDAVNYQYPDGVDIVFAFASILHVDKENLKNVFKKVANSLRSDGIFYISTKERSTYCEEIKSDRLGTRLFYYYNVKLLNDLSGDELKLVYEKHNTIGDTNWLTVAFKKSP